MPPAAPPLSIVVALISGKVADLARCLDALAAQRGAPDCEILVPWDPPCAAVRELATRHPQVRFLEVAIDSAAARAGASREHHDTLRTAGLRAARGATVILTEDHAHADPGWCAALLAALADHPPAGCVGGAVECGAPGLLAYAVFLCDFGRYRNPLPEATAWYVSDSNVAYRRTALDAVARTWRDDGQDYHETIVHGALAQAGHELWLTPRAIVWQTRTGLTLGAALRERFVWGQSFAGSRVVGAGLARRLLFVALTPALPFLLTWRLLRGALQKGRDRGRTLAALPLLFLLNAVWALGELAGYLRGRPK